MATAHRRITRKELRQPDWFQVATEKAFDIYETNRLQVLAGVAGFIILLLAIWGWQVFRERQNAKAAEDFGVAAALYHAQKYAEAAASFEKVQQYRWSHYATFAYLYQAESYLAMNNTDKALAAAQRFVSATSPDSQYRQLGLVTLAHIEETKGQTKQALEHYAEAERIEGAFKDRALLGKARTSERLGDVKTALAAYRDYVKDNPGTPYALQIPALEAKVAGQTAPK